MRRAIRGRTSGRLYADLRAFDAEIAARFQRNIATNSILAEAAGDLVIQSALNHTYESSQSRQRSASVGVSVGIGLTGLSATGNVSVGYNNADSHAEAVTNSNAQLAAGGTVKLKSGNDTTVACANVQGRDVVAETGGNLNVESRQDTYTSRSSQHSVNISVGTQLGGAPLLGNAMQDPVGAVVNSLQNTYNTGGTDSQKTGSLNFSYGKGSHNRAWTDSPTTIVATNSVDLTVKGNTHLKGAAINAENGNLKIDTATLTYEDIQDYDRSKNLGLNVTLSHSWGGPEGENGQPATREQRAATGEIAVRDEAKQTELEAQGKTGKLTALNRALDKAQEVTKDEHTSVKFYASDTSIKTVRDLSKKAANFLESLVDDGSSSESCSCAKK